MMQEEDDDETVFDQQGLLDKRKKSQSKWDLLWYQRFTKTVALSLAFFALGLCIAIPGATLLDLKDRTETRIENISIIFTARSLGYLLGSIVGGVLFDYFDQQILLFYTLILTGMATISVPWCTALTALAVMIAVQGLAMGVLDTGGNMFCIKVWNKGSAPYMQVLHFSFAVGAFLAPLVARPFLLGKETSNSNSTVYSLSSIPVNIPLATGTMHGNMHRRDVWWWDTVASQQKTVRDVGDGSSPQLTHGADGQDASWRGRFASLRRASRQPGGANEADSAQVSYDSALIGMNATFRENVSAYPFLNTTTTTTDTSRAAKPQASDGKRLVTGFANGEKASYHLIAAHKDNQMPPEDGEVDIAVKSESLISDSLNAATTKAQRIPKQLKFKGKLLKNYFASLEKASDHIEAPISFISEKKLLMGDLFSDQTFLQPIGALKPALSPSEYKNGGNAVESAIPYDYHRDSWLMDKETSQHGAPRDVRRDDSGSLQQLTQGAGGEDASWRGRFAGLHSASRQAEGIDSAHIANVTKSSDTNSTLPENINTSGFPNTTTTTTEAPRAAMPQASEGKHLKDEFASGQKALTHFAAHKDDQRPPDNDKGGSAPESPNSASPDTNNGLADGTDASWRGRFAGLHRASRQAEDMNDTDSAHIANVTKSSDTNSTLPENIDTSAFPNTTTTTTEAPRAAKPQASEGKHLKDEFASGEKALNHFNAHKDDQRPPDNDKGGSAPESPKSVSPDTNNGLADGTGALNRTDRVNETDTETSTANGSNSTVSGDNVTIGSNISSVQGGGSVATAEPKPSEINKSTTTTKTESTTTSTPTTITPQPTTTTPKPTTTTPKPTTTTPKPTTTTPKPTTTTSVNTVTTAKEPAVAPVGQATNSANAGLASSNGLLLNGTTTAGATPVPTHPSKPKFADVISSTIDAVKNMSNIQSAYMIVGLVLIGNAVVFLILYWRDCRAGTLLHQVTALGPSPPPTSSCFRVSVLSLLFVFFLFYVGVEVTFGGLVTTFAVESPLTGWTRQQGATLAALFWGSIAVGRGLAIFIARFFKPPCMLVVDLTLMLIGAVMLSFTLQSSTAMLWVGTVTLGLGMSSIFPTAVSWADVHYPLTGRATAVFITGSGVGEMVIPVVTGYLFEKYNSLYLMYVVLSFSCLVTFVFIMLQCIAWRNPIPASASKLGFVPLASEEENGIGMYDLDDVEVANGSNRATGYTETARRRQAAKKFVEDAEEETMKLMDSSD